MQVQQDPEGQAGRVLRLRFDQAAALRAVRGANGGADDCTKCCAGAPPFEVRAPCTPAFFAILVPLHQYFTRFWSFCISISRDFGCFASVFCAMRDARCASASENRAKIAKNREKTRKQS